MCIRGKTDAFVADVKKINAAISKAKWGSHYNFYSLSYGGKSNTFVLVVDHPNYADFAGAGQVVQSSCWRKRWAPRLRPALMKHLDADALTAPKRRSSSSVLT